MSHVKNQICLWVQNFAFWKIWHQSKNFQETGQVHRNATFWFQTQIWFFTWQHLKLFVHLLSKESVFFTVYSGTLPIRDQYHWSIFLFTNFRKYAKFMKILPRTKVLQHLEYQFIQSPIKSKISQFRQICVSCVHPGPKWQLPSALVLISIAILGNLVWLVCKPSVQFFQPRYWCMMLHTLFAAGSSSDWEGFQLDWGQGSCQATSETNCCHYLSAKCWRWELK